MTINLNKLLSVAAILYLVVFCIWFVPSPNHGIRIHDTFDGNFSTRHVLIKSGHFWDTNPASVVPGIMNGLPRGVFPGFTDMAALMMYLFGSLGGFAVTFFLVRLIGFVGFYLLARDHLNFRDEQRGFLLLVSAAFACLPVFIVQGISVTGVPLLFWAFFNLVKSQKTKRSFAVFVLFGLWSQMVLIGFHVLLVLFLFWIVYALRNRRMLWTPLLAMFLLLCVYILSNYMLFYLHAFDTGYQSSRGNFQKVLGLNFKGVIGATAFGFFTNDCSSANYFGYLFLPFIFWYAFSILTRKVSLSESPAPLVLGVLLISSFLVSLLDWKGFEIFYHKFAFANSFNFKRFNNVMPAMFFCVAAVSVGFTYGVRKQIFYNGGSLFVIVLLIFIWRGNISYTNSGFNTTGLTVKKDQVITFNQFFDSDLYKRIKQELGPDTLANVIHFGYSPSPSKYAGLNVLDDYQGDYPKQYKAEFRKIIEPELYKSQALLEYFDQWGSRCYLESAMHFEERTPRINGFLTEPELNINTKQLKAMNCNYIISAICIQNSSKLGLSLKKLFLSGRSGIPVLLYHVN